MTPIVKLRGLDVVSIATTYTLRCAIIIYRIDPIFKPGAD